MLIADEQLVAIEAEFIGLMPLGESAYLRVNDPEALVFEVVGVSADFMVDRPMNTVPQERGIFDSELAPQRTVDR
jgi:hypothetical protein